MKSNDTEECRRQWIQARGEELARGGLAHDDVDDIRAVEVATLAEELLLAVIVAVRVEGELPAEAAVWLDARDRVLERPASEGAGAILDVVLGVIPDAHREQFEQLTTVILVVDILRVELVVQPEEHCRVLRQLKQDGLEVAERVLAEGGV